MNPAQTELLAENLIKKVKSHLISTIGRTVEDASSDEFYRALCYALREETMINWMATARTIAQQKVRMVYYFSLEYLPGRLFLNNITNLCSNDVVRILLQRMNRSYRDMIECERSRPGKWGARPISLLLSRFVGYSSLSSPGLRPSLSIWNF